MNTQNRNKNNSKERNTQRWREVKDFSSQSFSSDTLQGKLSE